MKTTILIFSFLFFNLTIFGQMTIMTFNIRYDSPNDGEDSWALRKNELCQLINSYHPDFIGIQESMPNQVEYISKHLKDYAFVGYGRDGENTNSESVPLFYNSKKHQLLNSKIFWLSPTPNKTSIGWDAALNRITTYGAFLNKKTNDTIHIFNTHFDHIGKVARLNSSELILHKIKEYKLLNKPVILLGDFNSLPEDDAIIKIKNVLNDSYNLSEHKPIGPIGTFNGFDHNMVPQNRIDYIFTQNLKVLTYQVINDKRKNQRCISDHLPVLIDVSKNKVVD